MFKITFKKANPTTNIKPIYYPLGFMEKLLMRSDLDGFFSNDAKLTNSAFAMFKNWIFSCYGTWMRATKLCVWLQACIPLF